MTHPRMFDDDDPFLSRLRGLALRLPGAAEKVSHGRPAFFTRKVFAYFGGSVKLVGGHEQHPQSVMFLVDPGERPALVEEPAIFVPAYLGQYGWLGLDLRHADWAEVAELVEQSYRLTAPAKAIAELDARSAQPPGRR